MFRGQTAKDLTVLNGNQQLVTFGPFPTGVIVTGVTMHFLESAAITAGDDVTVEVLALNSEPKTVAEAGNGRRLIGDNAGVQAAVASRFADIPLAFEAADDEHWIAVVVTNGAAAIDVNGFVGVVVEPV